MSADPARPPRLLSALRQPRVLVALLLGFGSGLPFLLTGNTLGFWLRGEGWELSTIGFLSWTGLAYSLKVFWSPVVDRAQVPLLGRWLGQRRGWLLLSQIVVGAGLLGMALVGPTGGWKAFAVFAVVTAFASATQDIVADAWRIEAARTDEEQGLMTSAFQLGYRAALLFADALILFLAARVGWVNSYVISALVMGIAVLATFLAQEHGGRISEAAEKAKAAMAPLWTPRGFADAVVGPFVAFFKQHGHLALLMLAAVSLYRLPDFLMGPMAAPFYTDLGLSSEQVGSVRLVVGLGASFVGIALGGLCSVKLGFGRTLLVGALVGPLSNLAFSAMALAGPNLYVFGAAIAVDNASAGFAGASLVAYMSSLTSLGYTATQYALLSSTYAFLGKFLKGFSGKAVEWLAQGSELLTAYAIFFAVTALVGAPAVVLCIYLERATRRQAEAAEQARLDQPRDADAAAG